MLLQVGRVCIKKYGRDAGSRAVVTSVGKDGFVNVVTAERQKERRCNPSHLEFLVDVVDPSNKEQVAKTLGIREKISHAAPKTGRAAAKPARATA